MPINIMLNLQGFYRRRRWIKHEDEENTMMTMVIYDADLPIHMKDGMVKLKKTVESINNSTTDFESLTQTVLDLDGDLTHGLNQIKNVGYVTEGMANGEPTPDWVPIKKKDAIKEAIEFLKSDPNLNPPKIDKRSKNAYSEEEWEQKQQEKKEKRNDKKRKLEEYDEICEQLEHYKEKAQSYKTKFLKCKEYFLSNSIAVPE